MPRSETTLTASLLTPPGRGAVAVVRVHASTDQERGLAAQALDSYFAAANGRPISAQPIGRLCYGHWKNADASEDVVVCRTDDAIIEISCHGGRAAVNRVLESLKLSGVRIEDWQSQQAEITSAFDAELSDALARATTARTAAILLDQMSGTLTDALKDMLSLNEAELASRLDGLLMRAPFGRHLTQPWRVVLAGRPNVGKSTLINTLLGYTRAIVFDQPGTTRDVVTGQTAFDGWPFLLADTAGIRNATEELERAGIERALRTVGAADLVCLLLDTSQPATLEDQTLLAEFARTSSCVRPPVIVVAHKVDLPNQWTEPLPEQALPVSSATRQGVDELMTRIVQTLIPEVPLAGTPVPVSERQVQWLRQARQKLTAEGLAPAVAALENCLSGLPFEN